MVPGDAITSYGFHSDPRAIGFADTLWDVFFEGSSSIQFFGLTVLDGYAHSTEGLIIPF